MGEEEHQAQQDGATPLEDNPEEGDELKGQVAMCL